MKSLCLIPARLQISFLSAMLCFSLGVYETLGQASGLQVYVANQGNFSDANGSVTRYNPEDGSLDQDIVMGLNTLVQSITVHERIGYIVGNTSDRIDVVDLETNERIAQISDVPGPRFMKVVSDEKAYISNLFSSSVTVIDLESNTATGSITVGMNPEGIAVSNGRAFVANFGFGTADSTLSVIDISTDSVAETMQTGCDGPRFLEVDKESELWVFCNGKTVYNDDFSEIIEQTNGEVVIFASESGEEVARIELDAQPGTSALGQDAWYDTATNRMFFIEGASILVFDATANELAETIEIPGEEEIGAVAYHADTDVLYVARITGFTTAGFVSIHDMMGTEIDRFDAGVAPAFIAFYDPSALTVSRDDSDLEHFGDSKLLAAYPNPFSGSTSIPFNVEKAMRHSVTVYNALGQEVATLFDDYVLPGQHVVEWVTDAPAGIYYYQLSNDELVQTKMITIVR